MDKLVQVFEKIREIADEIEEVCCIKLFGSRARGDAKERSDIDLAIFGKNIDQVDLTYRLESEVFTLLEFDISYMEDIQDDCFREQVEKEGVIIYEKPRF